MKAMKVMQAAERLRPVLNHKNARRTPHEQRRPHLFHTTNAARRTQSATDAPEGRQ
ncbi:MAG TPA: hypothetical protein VGW12_06700 [Pyrinomonadaceae bacterium]|nr:hypothetical protein [Pyrinomonadaceae bacterium]